MAYQPQFVPPSSPVPPGAPTGYSPPSEVWGAPPVPGPYPPAGAYGPPEAYGPPGETTVQAQPGYAGPGTYIVPQARPQRPAVIGMSAAMTVTAAALWVCALASAWLLAAAGQSRLQADQDFDGQVLILLNRFSARLLDGLALPLFGLPAVAFVAAFLLLSGRRWSQLFYTVLGLASVAWLLWWLRLSLTYAVAPAAYIAIAVGMVWSPAALRWYDRRGN